MKSLIGIALRSYLWIHERLHERILHSIAIRYFDGLHPKNIFHYRSEFFIENVDRSDIVIDLACGTGRILGSLSGVIERGMGFDLSDRNLVECARHHSRSNLVFRKGNILELDYESLRQEFPYRKAVLSHILEHIEDVPALLKRVNAEELLICVPSQENWYRQTLKHLGLRYVTDETHFREYTREMLQQELIQSGYRADFLSFNSEGEIVCRACRT